MINRTLLTLNESNSRLRGKMEALEEHEKNLDMELEKINAAKAYKIWTGVRVILSKRYFRYLSINKIIKGILILLTKGPFELLHKLKSHSVSESYKKTYNEQYRTNFGTFYPSRCQLIDQSYSANLLRNKPLVTIVTPTYNTPIEFLRECIESVINQTYTNWEMVIVDDFSINENVKDLILEYAKREKRIKFHFNRSNLGIAQTTNHGIDLSEGEYIGFLDHDDILWPNALFEVVKAINKHPHAQLIYSDEDKISLDGHTHEDPFFKPEWSPNFLRSINYITHFLILNKDVALKVGKMSAEYEGAQDWELLLRISRQLETNSGCHPLTTINKTVIHIPKILYSWRKSSNSTASDIHAQSAKVKAFESQKKALEDDICKRGFQGVVMPNEQLFSWRIKYEIKGEPLVSIIIPTKDKYQYIKMCLESVLEKTVYKNFELIIVDTGSSDMQVELLYQQITKRHQQTKVLRWANTEFNFASVCNFGSSFAKGKYLLFLNNDTIVINNDWLNALLEIAQLPKVGAVGAKLFYPNNLIQHAGVILGIRGGPIEKGVAGHAFILDEDNTYSAPIHISKHVIREYSAVTAACIMINKDIYELVGGMDTQYEVAFNDIDLCLKILSKGFYNLFTPYCKLYHHESVSVLKVTDEKRNKRTFIREIRNMLSDYGDLLEKDPYYNINYDKYLAKFNLINEKRG